MSESDTYVSEKKHCRRAASDGKFRGETGQFCLSGNYIFHLGLLVD